MSVEAHNDRGKRFSADGQYALTVTDHDVILRPTSTHAVSTSSLQHGDDDDDAVVRWRLTEIRKLKCESVSNSGADLVTLVATRSVVCLSVCRSFRDLQPIP